MQASLSLPPLRLKYENCLYCRGIGAELNAQDEAQNKMHRMGTWDEMLMQACYQCSDAISFTIGQNDRGIT